MDLGAFVQIEAIDAVAKANGIDVPRLRGYRLMRNEKPIPKEQIDESVRQTFFYYAEDYIRDGWYGLPYREWKVRHYLDEENKTVRWDRVHGKLRRYLKFLLKKTKKAYAKSIGTFNRYCGSPGVLYIHARIGGRNWTNYSGDTEIATQPWFLEKVDDPFDDTYCDIYAKIKEE